MLAVAGTDEVERIRFHRSSADKIQFGSAVGTIQKSAVFVDFTHRVASALSLPHLPDNVPCRLIDNGFMCVFKSVLLTLRSVNDALVFISLGVDLITSEKEKNTLAGYLLMPIKRSDIAFSKCISLAIITVVDSFFMMGIMMIVMPFAMELFASDAFETIVFQLGIKQIIMLAIILISTAVLISAIVCYISSICKSTKAASGISVALYILSIVCGFSVMFDSILSVGLLTDAIPYLGNAAVIREIISGEQRMHDVLISVGSNMAISVILVWLTSKAFSEEKHMVSF